VEAKIPRLREFIDPVKSQWQDGRIQSSLGSYPGFCELLGLDKAQAYLAKHRAHEIRDWGSCPLDAEGLAIQAELEERLKVSLLSEPHLSHSGADTFHLGPTP
jgi:exportin-5